MAIQLRFTVTLELTQEEYALIEQALNRQLKGDDVGRAKALRLKLEAERGELTRRLAQVGVSVPQPAEKAAEPERKPAEHEPAAE